MKKPRLRPLLNWLWFVNQKKQEDIEMNAYKIDFVANTITITADFAKAMNDPTSSFFKEPLLGVLRSFSSACSFSSFFRFPSSKYSNTFSEEIYNA